MLDQLDKKILQTLEADARQSKSKIAEQLGVSKTVVTYRINRLEKNGIIKGYKYISNQAVLGLLSFGLLIRFQGLFLDEQAQILNRMRMSKKFNWVAATNGRWDAIAVAIDNDVHSFNRRLDVFLPITANILRSITSTSIMRARSQGLITSIRSLIQSR